MVLPPAATGSVVVQISEESPAAVPLW